MGHLKRHLFRHTWNAATYGSRAFGGNGLPREGGGSCQGRGAAKEEMGRRCGVGGGGAGRARADFASVGQSVATCFPGSPSPFFYAKRGSASDAHSGKAHSWDWLRCSAYPTCA